MERIVCYVSLVLFAGFIHSSFGQGNVFSANRQAPPRRQIVPRPPTSTMSPEHMQIAMRNKAMAMSTGSTGAQGSKSNNAGGGNAASNSGTNSNSNNNNNNMAANGGGQSRNSNQRSGNRWQNNNRQQPMMFCPHQMPSDCPEIQPKPGCFSQNIMSWMGRPCRGCPFDMCERSGYNPMDMAKKMAKMGMNPMQFMNQMNPMGGMGGMGGMHPAMYNSNFFENMPSWMRYTWGNNAFLGGGGNSGGGGNGNNGGGGGGGNHQGGGGSQTQTSNNNNQGSVTTTMSPWLWHSLLTK